MAVFFRKLIDLILYSNVWIALAAVAMCLQTEWLLFGVLRLEALWGFVFFATLFLYALHRLVALTRIGPFVEKGRFGVISRYRRHIGVYAALAAAAGAVFFFALPFRLQTALVIPCLISLGYVLPVLRGGRRLRDLPHLKIFLVALAWSWITVALPAISRHWLLTAPTLLMIAERALFIFALTLPFDIRDRQLDAYARVRTLPARLGIPRTRVLAAAALIAMALCAGLNYRLDAYGTATFAAIALSAALTYPLVHFADRVRHDYYFTGLIDGMMIGQFGLVWMVG